MVAVCKQPTGDKNMTTESNTKGKAPTHAAYQVKDREGKPSFWNRLGSAWQHQDGKGFSIQLDSLPLDGRITLREISEQE
jgi:hypothetical protein